MAQQTIYHETYNNGAEIATDIIGLFRKLETARADAIIEINTRDYTITVKADPPDRDAVND